MKIRLHKRPLEFKITFFLYRSVVVATIFYDGNSVVDLNQLETRLTANKTQSIVEATVMEYKNENRLLFWILMFLLILLIIIIVICVLCCIWQGCCVCPWMVIDRKRVVSPSENVKLLLRERGGGHETKGVLGKLLLLTVIVIDPLLH